MHIALANISKVFPGGVVAVRDLSLDVRDGELLVILGPSGCGKTTTLRLVAGLEQPTAGDVLFAGQRMNRARPAQRNVGFVFQQPVLYPHLTVQQNLAFVLRRSSLTQAEREQRIEDVAKLFRIADFRGRRPGEISVGEAQRVALARAVLRQPSCLLLDEPLASLDAPLRGQLRHEIRAAHEQLKLTSIFVTHDQQEAFALADRIALLSAGDLQQLGRPMELYEKPANVFAASFIGSPGMNLLAARVEREADGAVMFNAGGGLRMRIPSEVVSSGAGEFTLGVRPEHVALGAAHSADANDGVSFDVEVTHAERFGDHVLVHARTRTGAVINVKVMGRSDFKPGESVVASVRTRSLRFFEAGANGRRIVTA